MTVTAIEATASCRADVGGLLGVEGTTPALEGIRLEVLLTSPDPQERVDAMFAAWRERCPIHLALRDRNEVLLDLRTTG